MDESNFDYLKMDTESANNFIYWSQNANQLDNWHYCSVESIQSCYYKLFVLLIQLTLIKQIKQPI